MKSILISTQPKWCEKICRKIGEQNGIPVYLKPVEVRKSAPKEVPFRAYLYCTKERKPSDFMTKSGQFGYVTAPECAFYNRDNRYDANGKVIGEFVCDRVDKFSCKCIPRQGIAFGYERFIKDGVYLLNNNDTDYVVFERQDKYLDTMLKNADLAAMCLTPRDLFQYAGGFSKPLYAWHISALKIYDTPRELSDFKTPDSGKPIDRPPQSWRYVEECL